MNWAEAYSTRHSCLHENNERQALIAQYMMFKNATDEPVNLHFSMTLFSSFSPKYNGNICTKLMLPSLTLSNTELCQIYTVEY